MRRLTQLMLSTLALLAAGGSWAQSLQEIYEAARAYDATYLAARAQVDSVQYRTAQSYALRRPSVSANGTARRIETNPPSTLNNPSGDRFSNSTGSLSIDGRQSLFNRANTATIDQAERSLAAAEADLQLAEQELIVRVAQTYFDALVAQDTLTVAEASKTAIAEQLASAKRNFEVGTATITDTREAQARFDLATATVIAAENDLRGKRIALDQLVGRSNVTPKPLAVPVALPTMTVSVDDWVGLAESGHPLVRKADLGLAIAQLETEKARAGHLPTLDAVASVASNRLTGSTNFGNIGTASTASLGLQLAVPVFSGFAVENRVKETLSLEERSRNDLEAARRGVAQATRVAYFDYLSGQAQVTALEAAESSSKLALEATQLGYRVGVRVNLDVLDSQRQLFVTQRDLSKARYDVLLSGLRLRRASGTLLPSHISIANSLLVK
jgi:outer membrane protein